MMRSFGLGRRRAGAARGAALLFLLALAATATRGARAQSIPTAAANLMKQAAIGAAQGAANAVIESQKTGTPTSDPKEAAARAAKAAAIGAANGAMQGAGVGTSVEMDPATGAVNVGQVTARSPTSVAFYSSMLNVAASSMDMSDTQKAVMLTYTAAAISQLNTSIELNCAWQASVGLNFNVAFPDGYAVYHILFVPTLQGPMDIIRIEGDYPFVRYFSYQSYDPKSMDPVASIRDYAIKPLQGVNPFATSGSKPSDKGKYQVHISLRGDQGYPNELPTIAKGSNATGAFVLLRVYAYDKQSPNKTDIWGAVKPPVVRYKLYDKTKSGGGVWYTLDRCSEENTRVASQFVSTVATGAARALASEEQTGQNPCPTWNVRDQFRLFRRTNGRAPFMNHDANYLLSCGSEVDGGGVKGDLVAVVTGTLPPAPGGLWQPPYVADYVKYSSRYLSLSSYDLKIPGPVLQTLWDADIASFYSQYYGSEYLWGLRARRQYKIVMASDISIAKRCGHLTEDAMFLSSWGGTAKVNFPGLVLREILAQGNRNGSAFSASAQTIYNVKQGCQANPAQCETAAFASSVMKENYPKVVYFDCLPNGKVLSPPYNASATY